MVDANPASTSQLQRWERIRALFHAAVQQPASLRLAFLDRACDGDLLLRADVATLLRADDEGGAFMDSPVVQTAFTTADPSAPVESSDHDPPTLQHRVISHYRLQERLGAGGMGVVYRAVDTALGRESVLKLLPEAFTPALRERLLHEADTCAHLQHPAIATYYESGEADGVAFIAMEFVRGQTLRERLRQGPLAVDTALAITECLLDALSHAHALGILHRDIKPENIIVTGNRAAKLVDFGIAKHLLVSDQGATTAAVTQAASSLIGTIGYMSPEQVRNDPLDVRSDLFQVGAVLYEMLSGSPAFIGATVAERLAAILSADPVPLTRSEVGTELDAVVHRALARERERRYPSAAAFLTDLLRISAGEWSADLPACLAVLDFQSALETPADDWIASGLAENLALELSHTPLLTVVGRDKVLGARQALTATDITSRAAELGLALGCRWVLTGTYRRLGAALRVTAYLVEAVTGRSSVDKTVDGTLEQIFEIQDQIAAAARASLTVETSAEQMRSRTTLPAYECYARGQRLVTKLEKGSFDQARDLFDRAIQQDPRHARALTGLANIYALRHTYTTDSTDLETATSYARRAIDADPTLADPHVWLGYALTRWGRPSEAATALKRARELNASWFLGFYFGAALAIQRGRLEEALPLIRQAVALEPNAVVTWWVLGAVHLALGQLAEALSSFTRGAQRNRASDVVHPVPGISGCSGECLRRMGRLDEARKRCFDALEEVERTDFMYRDTTRVVALVALGRVTSTQADLPAARAAFQQALAHIRGRPRMTGSGPLMVQTLSGLAVVNNDAKAYDDACLLDERREKFNFNWVPLCDDAMTCLDLARAATALGRGEVAQTFLARARAAGWIHAPGMNW